MSKYRSAEIGNESKASLGLAFQRKTGNAVLIHAIGELGVKKVLTTRKRKLKPDLEEIRQNAVKYRGYW